MSRKHNHLVKPKKAEPQIWAASPALGQALQHKLLEAERERQAGHLEEAKQLCLQILEVDARQPDCLNLLGVLLNQNGHFEVAVKMFRRAIALNDRAAHYHSNLAFALQSQGKLAEATAEYKQAVALRPNFAEGLSDLGENLRQQGKLDEARVYLEKALALKPDLAAALNNLGAVERLQGDLHQAAARLERAVALQPDYPEALTNLGAVLWELGELEQAKARLERALVLKPDYAGAYLNLGAVFEAEGRPNDALAQYERALALKPDFPRVQWNRALVQLLQGDYAAGWQGYQWRYQIQEIAPRYFPQPLWRGEPLTGARIRLHAEQGLGDTLQFLRYLPLVVATGATVLLDVPASMRRLAEELTGIAALTVSGERLEPFDWHCPLMDLPLAFRTTLESIPAQVPYLSIPAAAQQAAATLAWPEGGVRAGVVWSGSPDHKNDRNRSLPLALLAPLFAIEGVHLFSLQLGPAAAQLASFPAEITDLSPAIGDLADTAALMAHLDLVITVDTAVAHLAGALGKPVWLLLPFVPDWRWLLDREDSPWYPTMRLFRQPKRGEWPPVIAQVREELAALASGDRDRLREKLLQGERTAGPSTPLSLEQKLAEAYRECQAGNLDQAKQLCLQILEVDTRQPDCLNLLGVLQNKTGHFQGAVNMFRRAIALNNTIAHYYSNLGFALKAQGKLTDAVVEYKRAIALEPDFVDGLTSLGHTLRELGELAAARTYLERALTLEPNHAAALHNLGAVERRQGELDQAAAHMERALVLKPDSPEVLSNLGAVLRELGELEQAEARLQRALLLKPDFVEAYLNLGMVFAAQGQHQNALVQFERALALKPDSAEAHLNCSLMQLLQGDYAAGWQNYEWRYHLLNEVTPRSFSQPLWRGEALNGARILLHSEQGLGDTLQFLRYLPLVLAQGATILLDVPASVRRLAEQLSGIAALTVAGESLSAFDWHCPLMSLPLAFRTTLETIPAQVPYLSIPEAAQQAAATLSWPEQGVRVGLVWGGSPDHKNDRSRSLPLALLAPLFLIEGVHLFSLQLGPAAAQLASFPTKITDLAPAIGDLADTAALIAHLDLVITVDTAVAHLAGALGKPVWVMLPFAPDWRWLLNREDSPWYPTMRLFRQPGLGEWTPVVARVRTELAALAGADRDRLREESLQGERTAGPSTPLRSGRDDKGGVSDFPEALSYTLSAHPTFVIPTGANPDFAPSYTGESRVCGFPAKKTACSSPAPTSFTRNQGERSGGTCSSLSSQLLSPQLQHKLAEAHREHQAGHLEQAKQLCLQILQVDPRLDDCLNLLGVLQHQTGNFADAADLYRQAIAVNGAIAHYHANLGLALQAQGNLADAVAAGKQAVLLQPDFVDAMADLGNLMRKHGQIKEARAQLEQALALKPDHATAHVNLSEVLREQGELEQAVAHLKKAIELKPDYAEAHNNLGAVLRELGELEQARVHLRRALVLKPNYVEAYLNLGVVFEALGQLDQALLHFDRALALNPNAAKVHFNRSLVELRMGDFAAGWQNYQWRYQVKETATRTFPQPLWRGEPLAGARILLHAEQGLGDTLQFLRYLPLVQAAGGTVLLHVQPQVRRLAEQLGGIAQVTVKGESLDPFDWHCPLMGLPLAFRTTLETIPAQVPYLSIPEAAQQAAAALSWPGNGLRVGLVWSGSPTHKNDRRRSLHLSQLAPLFAVQGVHLFSLQLGPGAAQLEDRPGTITDLAPAIDDFADTAALMAHLDLVITVDTAVAHLAGALGKPVWVLLPFAPDWRWMLDRQDSPWYPTMRLFRQPKRNEWTPVIARVRAALAALAGGDRGVEKLAKQKKTALKNHRPPFCHPERSEAEARDLRCAPAGSAKAAGSHTQPLTDIFRATQPRQDRARKHAKLGLALYAQGKLAEAVAEYRQAVRLWPSYADGLCDLGELLRRQGQLAEARVHLEKALALNPNHAAALNNLSCILRAQGSLDEAAAHLERALTLRPDYVEALTNLGGILWEQGELDQARARLERALVAKADDADAHVTLGAVFESQGKPRDALVLYERALALKPDFPQAHWNRGLVQLLLGDYAAGWRNYEWRYQVKGIAPRNFSEPLWRGEPLGGARILLHAEQGLGDTLQFLRYVPMVKAAGGAVLLDVPASLRRLAAELPGIAALTVSGESLQPFDWQCPLMGLPLALRTTLETIPAQVPYLSIPEASQQAAAALSWPERGLRVGLVWSGSPTHKNDRRRSLALSLLAPLLTIQGVHLFSLQLGPGAAQLATFPGPITDLSPAISDLADTAALMAHLDLVITVDTGVAHLAGALAKRVWVLLPFAPDWRWLLDREDSPWYPTMRLFRQAERNEWTPVVERVRAALAAMAAPDSATNARAHLLANDDPRPIECKICAGPSSLFGVVDFHKSCIEAQGKRLPLSGRPVYYRRCGQCGFTFTTAFDAWDDQSFHDHIYNDDYLAVDPDFTDVRPSGNAKLVASVFAASRASISILDYGGGSGRLASLLREQGFSAETYDPFSSFHHMPSEKFDLITSFEVLEHVPFPRKTVATMVSLLKPGGALLFSTLVQPADFATVGLRWWYAGPRNGHVSLYSTQSLALLFREHGMKVGSFNANLHIAYKEVPAFASHLKFSG